MSSIRTSVSILVLLVALPVLGQETPFDRAVAGLESCKGPLEKCAAFATLEELTRADGKFLDVLAGGSLVAQQSAVKLMARQGMDTKALFRLMESTHREVVLETLGLIANTRQMALAPSVLERARKAHQAGDEQLLLKTLFAIGRLEYGEAAPLLMELIHSDIQKIARAAIEALGRVGGNDEVVGAVVKQARDASLQENRRLAAIRGLGYFKQPVAVDALVEFSRDDNVAYRKAAVLALGTTQDRRAVPQLFERMKDPEVLPELIDALARIGGEKAAAMLYNLAMDETRAGEMRDNALVAAGRAGSQRALPELLKALKSSRSQWRTRAAEAIGYLGDPGAIEALYVAYKKARGSEKTMLHWAIKRCSKEALDTDQQIEDFLKQKSSK
jgi:hypothetical protein